MRKIPLARTLLALSLCALKAPACFAHAKLQSSTPANEAELAQAPKTLTLVFSEAAQLAVLKLVGAGKDVALIHDNQAKPERTFSIALPLLAPGMYTVQWSAVAADDGHVTRGSFVFKIAG